ncbi:PAS domain S-box protein [Deinococcus pimensis]|uniref:PAS domain S-box protein n=1 Tax=Deinococcus pimensis TaxID=309888 RepID=UPI0004B99AC2|nr:PAS domain S-box protein [Deinococcus pimensis]
MPEPLPSDALDLLDDLPLPALVSDPTGAVLHVNPALRTLTDRPLDELLGRGFLTLVHPDDRPVPGAPPAWVDPDGRPVEHELRLLTPGGYRWQCLQSRPRGAHGARVVCTLHDIHALKLVEHRTGSALHDERAAHARLRDVLDASPTLMWTARDHEDVLHFNRTWSEYTGLPAVLPREAWEGALHPDDLERVRRVRAEARADRRPYELDARFRRQDGSYRWQHVSVRPFGQDEWLGVATDVHDRRDSEAKLHLTLQAGGLGVWTYDVGSGRTTRTPEAARLLDVDDADAPFASFAGRVHEEDRGRVTRDFEDVLRDGGPEQLRVEHRYFRADGRKIWTEHRVHVERDEQGRALRLLGVTADVTARKRDEERLTLLADAGETLARNLDVTQTLTRLARLAVPRIADWCVVYLPDAEGVLTPVAVQHRDHEKVEYARRVIGAFPARVDDEAGIGRAFRDGETLHVPDLPGLLASVGPLPEGWQDVMDRLRLRSMLAVPLVAHGRPIGLLNLCFAESGRTYGEGDLPAARELANRAALALENAQLYHEARELNTTLEARVRERTAELDLRNRALEAFADLSRDFAAEADPARLVGRAQEILVGLLPGSASTYYEPAGERWALRSHRGVFRNPRLLDTLRGGLPRGLNPNLDRPFDTHEAYYQERYDPNTVPSAAHDLTLIRATASLPVLVGGEARGVLIVGSYEPRAWTSSERALLETVARSLGVALERADALRAVQHERTFLSGLLRSLSEGIVACDAQGRLTTFNAASEEIHGSAARAAPPERWAELYRLYRPDGETPLPREEVPLYRAWQGRRVQDEVIVVRRPDGERRLMVCVGGPIVTSGGEQLGAVVVMRDVTDRDRAEAALRQANRELKRSNEELEQFAYVASHDLQAPARAVTSFAGVLDLRYGHLLDERGHAYLTQIVRGGERMKRLVDDLLTFSRVNTQRRPLEPVDSARVLAEALELLTPDLQVTHALVTHDDLPIVRADEGQLSRVLVNLIGNALKYARPGVPPRVHVSARREGSMWRFSVRDNGLGIEERYFEQIFVPFKRLHSRDEIEGSGLGLAVSRKIVERHGGWLWLESTPGEGSVFQFTLPSVDADVAARSGEVTTA